MEAAWRVVDGILDDRTPLHDYEPGTWGPEAAARILARGDRWHDPGSPADSARTGPASSADQGATMSDPTPRARRARRARRPPGRAARRTPSGRPTSRAASGSRSATGSSNEVYWPRVDRPQIRDLGFIVADDAGFWSEVKRDAAREVRQLEPGVPAIIATHRHPRYTLTLRICADDHADVIHVEARLDDPRDAADPGRLAHPLRLYPLLAPHLGFSGLHNSAWAGTYKGAGDALRSERRGRPRARLGPGPRPPERGLRRRLGRLAGLRDERPDGLDVPGRRRPATWRA